MSETISAEKRYKKWIVGFSIAIPLLVAILFGVKIPNAEPLTFLPPIYATINGCTAVLLVAAFFAIKSGNMKLHRGLMKTCIGLSIAFLAMYMAYHMTSDSTPFGGEGWVRTVYFFILISHILLSIVIIPLVLITFVRGLFGDYKRHAKIARYTFPLWLYVAVSGVIVYVMISPYYVN